MAMALISMTWEIEKQPECSQKQASSVILGHLIIATLFLNIKKYILQRGVQLFLYWAIMQGVAMLLQNRYQRQRLYTRIALGKV